MSQKESFSILQSLTQISYVGCSKGDKEGLEDNIHPEKTFIGLFLLRMSGQGLMSHTSTTAISRFFEKRRGKALSVVFLGMSLGEFILPVLIVYLLSFIYWRDLWIIISVIIILSLPIIV